MPLNMRLTAAALVLAMAFGMTAPVAAQTSNRTPLPDAVDDGTVGKAKPAPQPQPKVEQPAAVPDKQDKAAAKPVPKPRLPQTAEEKSKALSDLYAQLQAAEDEAAAKKISDQIERIWAISGSDTVNLLIQRATKAAAEKKVELAQKLLDSAIELAPDYPEAFTQRAFFFFTQNNYEAAAGDLRRVLALDANHYKALEGLAQIWRETGNKKGAFRVIQQLIEVHPFAPGAKQVYEELKKEVDGQGI